MNLSTSKKEIAKRYILFIISLFFSGLGVALTKKGELGVSPISSVANVVSEKYNFLTFGNWLILWNYVFIFGQILLLQKNFKPIQLLQFPLTLLFGYFTDFGTWCLSFFDITAYPLRLLMVCLGTVTLGFGISLSVIANVIMNSGEAFVKALSDVSRRDFALIKTCFDVSCVLSSIILSLLFFQFKIVGTREGTVIAALCTGPVVKLFTSLLKSPLDRILQSNLKQKLQK